MSNDYLILWLVAADIGLTIYALVWIREILRRMTKR